MFLFFSDLETEQGRLPVGFSHPHSSKEQLDFCGIYLLAETVVYLPFTHENNLLSFGAIYLLAPFLCTLWACTSRFKRVRMFAAFPFQAPTSG